ncbi:hypothetical protein BGX38DRAFT_1144058 [Terfezia claveryi]|nr:hypothetical protein BGX38DRAFT_1144058 [Terfezia claveryi]
MASQYSNYSIDCTDPAMVEFYQTFGANQDTDDGTGVSDPSLANSTSLMDPTKDLCLTDHAIVLGVTEKKLAQILALAPDVSKQEISQILGMPPQMMQNPDLYFPEEEHPWGNLPCVPLQISTDSFSVDPMKTIINPPNVPPCEARGSYPQQNSPVSKRSMRVQRRTLLKALADMHRFRG